MITIKHRYTGAVLYQSETAATLAAAIQEATKAGSDLSYSNLSGSNLSYSNLRGSTSKGEFVMSNHNEHNGYYGGFYVRCVKE